MLEMAFSLNQQEWHLTEDFILPYECYLLNQENVGMCRTFCALNGDLFRCFKHIRSYKGFFCVPFLSSF